VPAISVGSVEVDVLPNASGIRRRLQQQVVPAADEVGEELGRIIGRHVSTQIASAVRNGITTGGRTATPQATRSGSDTGGAFGRAFRTRVEAALRDLPDVEIDADSTEAQREIARIRTQLLAMRDMQIGVDIDTAEATARVARLQERLQRLSASDADVQVRTDVAAASAQLAQFQALVNRIDGQDVDVDVDTRSAAANLNLLSTAAIGLGPALLPVLPVIAAGLGSIAAAGAAAAVGVGAVALVAAPAFVGIAGALQAQKAAQDAATNATYQGAQASGQGASKALQQASAAQSLATAERNGARQIAQAQQAVKQAKQSAADAATQAAVRNAEAARRVQDAERSLADAQRDAKRAQEDLTDARKQAEQELLDLNNQLTNAQLSQRDAEIALKEAAAERDKVLRAANSTELDKQKALLAYDQAVQRLKEQTAETKNLKSETAAANKAGVEGSDTYKSAQERVADAQRNVADQARGVRDAQAEAARTQVETARQVADAQQRVGEATANVAVAQQNAADAVASAQRQIESASISAAGGVDQAAIAQAKYEAELAKLTPSARDTFDAFMNLRTAFSAWSKALQPAVMPIFTRALEGMKNSLPGLTPIVLAAASAIQGLQDRASAGFKSPWWKEFKADLDGSVGPAITGLGISFGRVFKGMAGVIQAFFPHMDSISERMQTITGRFANWGTGLKGSPEFERFLSYSSEMAPKLGDAFGKIATAFMNVGQALSPLSGPLLMLLGGVAEAIGIIADKAPWFILLIYGIVVATKLWTIAVWAFNAAMTANPLVLIGLAILAVVALVIYAYNKFDWFRNLVQTVWSAIQTAVMWAWTNVLKPTFDAIWAALQTVGRWAMWLWTNAIKPSFDLIATAAKILLTAIVVLVLLPIIATIKIVGAIAMWLWTHAIKPAFDLIAAHAMWLWNSVFSPAFTWIGDKAKWLWANAIKPAWDSIKAAGKALWEAHLRPVFKNIWGGLQTIGKWAAWLYREGIKPSFDSIVAIGRTAWERGIKPVFDGWKNIIKGLGGLFKDAVAAIKTQWDRLKSVAKAPVKFVVDSVYNGGIVGVWNKVASAFGAPKLSKFKFADGGVMPGYTPGRDVHKFLSPTGGQLELSGGEAIMRPEFTRAVGSGFVGAMNSIAKSRGAQGVKAALAPVFGGNPSTPTDTSLRYAGGGVVQSFADGGIFGWIKDTASAAVGAGSEAWNKIKKGASWLGDTLEGSARAGVKNVVNPLLAGFPGMSTGFGALIRKIPDKIIDALFGYSKKADDKGAGGIGGPKIQKALNWAKTQDGLPYQWGGNGNPSWDCSGFMSAIESVIRGQKPHRRWSTHAFSGKTAPPGWVYHGNSPFKVGITADGVGHTAGTLGKTKVESRGGDGVIVGSGARGYNDRLFNSWYGFKPGSYDSGGYLQPGLNLAYNGTGRPEPVFTTAQANALTSMAARSAQQQLGDLDITVYVGNEQITDIARTEVRTAQGELIQVLNAG
jgi:phage-related protein